MQYIVVIGDVGEKPPMGGGYSPINEDGGVRMVPMSVLPMIPYGGHRTEETRPNCPECRTRGYRIEANKDEIYYNHGLQWHGPFTEAEATDLNTECTCETCGQQFNTTADLMQHGKDEHSGQAVERLERLYQANLPILSEADARKAVLSSCPHCAWHKADPLF
jgi:hypothetical protein